MVKPERGLSWTAPLLMCAMESRLRSSKGKSMSRRPELRVLRELCGLILALDRPPPPELEGFSSCSNSTGVRALGEPSERHTLTSTSSGKSSTREAMLVLSLSAFGGLDGTCGQSLRVGGYGRQVDRPTTQDLLGVAVPFSGTFSVRN